MIKYYVDQEGRYLGGHVEAPANSQSVPSAPSDFKQVWNGSGWGAVPDDRGHREKRKSDYIAEISPEGQFEETVGDTFDAILKFLATKYPDIAEDTIIGPLIVKISEIKARHPKP